MTLRHHYNVTMTSHTTVTSPEPTALHWVRSGQVRSGQGRVKVRSSSGRNQAWTFDRGQTGSNKINTFGPWPQSNLWPLTAVKGQTRSNLWPLNTVKRGQTRSNLGPLTAVKPLTLDRGQTRSNKIKPLTPDHGQTFDPWPQSNAVKIRSNLWPLTAGKP